MEAASVKWWEEDGVEPLPLTRSEELRERLNRWDVPARVMGMVLAFVVSMIALGRYGSFDDFDPTFLLVPAIASAYHLIPAYPLASAWVMRSVGARPLRLPLTPERLFRFGWLIVAIRKDHQWRLARVWSNILDAEVLPTAETVTIGAAHRHHLEACRNLSSALRAMVMLLCVPPLAGPFNLGPNIWFVVLLVALVDLMEATVNEVFRRIDWRLTGGEERPSLRVQREAILRVRAELTEGTRPATLAGSQVPLLLQPDVEGVPHVKHQANHRAAARLLAAYCLLDAEQVQEAEQVLQFASRTVDAAGAYVYELELSRLLAIVVLCNGGDLAEAQRLRKGGAVGGFDPYDFHVYEALRAHRRGFRRLAPREAEKAIQRMKRSIYPGQALAYEALLRRTLGLPERQADVATAD